MKLWAEPTLHIAIAIGSALLISCATGCEGQSEAEVLSFAGPTMGTRYSVRFVAESQQNSVEEIQARVDARLAEINGLMSTYDSDSELSRFNQYRDDDWFPVSAETAHVVQFALEIANRSDGAFDPTVGPAVNLWGFGPDKTRDELPTDEAIATALAKVDYTAVSVRSEPPALKKSMSEIYLDLSAVAKGYAVDQISELLAENGFDASMVEIGGEIRTRGHKPGKKPWRIALEKPDATRHAIQTVLDLSDAAIATSGDYRIFFEVAGKRYSHTIDPTTAHPVRHNLATVTVCASKCMEADALATALLVMGPDIGYDWAEKNHVAARFMARTEGGFEEQATTLWQSMNP